MTAIDWLKEKLEEHSSLDLKTFNELCKQAKQMEKEQIKSAHYHNRCIDNQTFDCTMKAFENAELYYNEMYDK